VSSRDHIHELNEAVATNDLQRFTAGMHPDAVWEHNITSSSSSFATGCSQGVE
jgi:hypothetical protein